MDGTLALKKYGLMNTPVTPTDLYLIQKVNDNDLQVTHKQGDEVISTTVYQSGTYTTYTVDNLFTLQYDGPWILTLLVASTTDDAGTQWTWQYGETPAVSEIEFRL